MPHLRGKYKFMTIDVLGEALLDFQSGKRTTDITTFMTLNNREVAESELLPLPYLFREYREMPALEQRALDLCRGTVLDIGCGAGSHSLYLQQKGLAVTALDRSKGAVETCIRRGLNNCVHANITDFKNARFDTLLLLMNGIGLAGTLKKLDFLLAHFKSLLNPGGQLLFDSSDIIYMFDQDPDGGYRLPGNSYYGEVIFQLEYKGRTGDPFPWLYLDYPLLQKKAKGRNLHCELVQKGDYFNYLTRITLK